jgi:cytochrome c
MDSFEFNKIAGGVLAACLFLMVLGLVSNGLVHAAKPDKAIFEEVAAADHSGETKPGAPPAAPEPIAPLLVKADAAKGEAAFTKRCTLCHVAAENSTAVKQGPNLWGVIGSPRAHVTGFTYSEAMKTKGGEWDFQSISEFITKPAAYVRGTKMAFAGLSNAAERADIIAYLRTQSSKPVPLPAP